MIEDAGFDWKLLSVVYQQYGKMSATDASQKARGCKGFAASGLSEAEAIKLQKLCVDNSIRAVVIPDSAVGILPAPKNCVRIYPENEVLKYTLKTGLESALKWADIFLAAAAYVSIERSVTVKVKEQKSDVEQVASGLMFATTGMKFSFKRKGPETKTIKEESHLYFIDLFRHGEPARLQIKSDEFDYSSLGSRKTYSSALNFNLLLSDIDKYALSAGKNQGFGLMIKKSPMALEIYKNYESYEKELSWLMCLLKLKK